jgi:hypothetical protein
MATMKQDVVVVPVDNGNNDKLETAVQKEMQMLAWQNWRLLTAIPIDRGGHTIAVMLFVEHTEHAQERPAAAS